MIYTVENTVKIGKAAIVTINGASIETCVRAFVFGPFVAAETIRTYKDGTPITFNEGFKTRWTFGLGRVQLVELAA